MRKDGERTVCCCLLPWPGQAGQVSMSVSTDRGGYCPGESVAIDATFANRSNRARVRPEAALVQTQTFTAGGKNRRKRTILSVLAGQSVRSGGELAWDSVLLKVPPVSPTIANCGFIRVEYFVRVTLGVPGSCDLSLSLPVVIGTVPHQREAAATTMAAANGNNLIVRYGSLFLKSTR